jgi:hypoxanthine phosphoribosyltransferase
MTTPSTKRLRILLRRQVIERRVRQMGAQITRDFKGQRVHLIGVLKGATIFLADLIRRVDLDLSLDFIGVQSYGRSHESSGQVRLTKDLDSSIEGLNVILVEDILDTRLTMNYVRRLLIQRKPRALRVATLLEKPGRDLQEAQADYVGFSIPAEFVVGYGLDYDERYRNLRDVYVMKLPSQSKPRSPRGAARKRR